MSGKSPGRLACEAFWVAIGHEPDEGFGPECAPGKAWQWAKGQGTTHAWEAAARAACEAHGHAVGLMDLAVANSQLMDRLAAQHDAMTQLRCGHAEALAAVTAERNRAVAAVANFARLFSEPDERGMRHADVTRATIDRYVSESQTSR